MTDLPIKVLSEDEVRIKSERLSRLVVGALANPYWTKDAVEVAEALGWREVLRMMDEYEEPKPHPVPYKMPTFEENPQESPFTGPHWDDVSRWNAEIMTESSRALVQCVRDLRDELNRLRKANERS